MEIRVEKRNKKILTGVTSTKVEVYGVEWML